jgi:hypothetical protein
MKKYYTQTTYETCLACCLLFLVSKIKKIKINPKIELACIIHSLKFSKDDFGIGHFDFILKKFNVHITRIIDNKSYFYKLKRKYKISNLKTENKKINLVLLDKYLEKCPILYLDAYYLFQAIHYPHFVVVLEKEKNGEELKYKIYDPWDGREKFISSKILSKAISSLRNHFKMIPEIILVEPIKI